MEETKPDITQIAIKTHSVEGMPAAWKWQPEPNNTSPSKISTTF